MGLVKWDYRSFKCTTPRTVIAAYRRARAEGWGFSMVHPHEKIGRGLRRL
jgi:hypothetical protein